MEVRLVVATEAWPKVACTNCIKRAALQDVRCAQAATSAG
jgi:hypothetical protein